MKVWTIMVIVYGTSVFDKEQSLIPYPSPEACGAAIVPVADTLSETFPDMVIQCVPTEVPSRVLRPKRNPIYGESQ